MDFEKPLSALQKQKLVYCFDLSELNHSERDLFYLALFNYTETYPVLKIIINDLLKSKNTPIKIKIKNLNNNLVRGIYKKNTVTFNKSYFKTCLEQNDSLLLAETLWHELVHFSQDEQLSFAPSQRGYLVYRQFIEAEAKAYSNLLLTTSPFEKALYNAIKAQEPNKFKAQRRYIGISAKLHLNADRELAEIDAKSIMGSYFSKTDWTLSEQFFVSHWKNYYYQEHQDYAKGLPQTKLQDDNKYISECELFFQERYDVPIIAKSSISKEVINIHHMNEAVENTLLVKNHAKDVFNLSKWRRLSTAHNQHRYLLDLPNTERGYINELIDYLNLYKIQTEALFVKHRDGFSSRCIAIKPTPENEALFLTHCQKHHLDDPSKTPIDESLCGYNQVIQNSGILIDTDNPPVFCMGKNFATPVDIAKILTKKITTFLKHGGILLIGRSPLNPAVKIPPEIYGYRLETIKLNTNDVEISRLQGYFYQAKDKKIYYKDCSLNGTYIKKAKSKKQAPLYKAVAR